ncbi:NADP-dependent oxidoreductase [Streptomyces sp. NPDC054770]
MQAIVYRRYGGPEVLELAEVKPPKVHVDSVLVRIRAAAVNPADLRMREGLADANVPTYFPVIPGWDISGVVEETGPGAPEFHPGDEVVGYVRTSVSHQHGGYAELVATDAQALAPKPADLSWEQAAALPLAGLTAYQAVTRVLACSQGNPSWCTAPPAVWARWQSRSRWPVAQPCWAPTRPGATITCAASARRR